MEETAYTWFNRLHRGCGHMQEHNLLPISVRVLPDAPGALPELVRQAQNVELDGVDFPTSSSCWRATKPKRSIPNC